MPRTVHRDIVIPQNTIGLSPKLIAAAITGLVGLLLAELAIPLPPALEHTLNVLAMTAAAWIAPPGAHPRTEIGDANDALLSSDVLDQLEQ
jgi:hypothetical protein